MKAYTIATANILVVLLVLLSRITAAEECKLVSTWESWEPYQYLDESGRLTGLDINILKSISNVVGCTIEFKQRPWKRTLYELKKGISDITIGASKNKERMEFANFSEPYRSEVMYLLVLNTNLPKYPFTTLEELMSDGYRIGVVSGYFYGDAFNRARNNKQTKASIYEIASDKMNIEMLLKGRADVVVVDSLVAKRVLSQLGKLTEVATHPLIINQNDIPFMFSKKSVKPDVIKKFNEAIITVKKSGELKKIIDSYYQ